MLDGGPAQLHKTTNERHHTKLRRLVITSKFYCEALVAPTERIFRKSGMLSKELCWLPVFFWRPPGLKMPRTRF